MVDHTLFSTLVIAFITHLPHIPGNNRDSVTGENRRCMSAIGSLLIKKIRYEGHQRSCALASLLGTKLLLPRKHSGYEVHPRSLAPWCRGPVARYHFLDNSNIPLRDNHGECSSENSVKISSQDFIKKDIKHLDTQFSDFRLKYEKEKEQGNQKTTQSFILLY